MKTNCKMCGKVVKAPPSYKRKYCSNQCQQAYQVQEQMELGTKRAIPARESLKIILGYYECQQCGLGPEWNGLALTLEIDHIDGDRFNNRKDNLRWMCPNCHSQTPNFRNKNVSEEGRQRSREVCRKQPRKNGRYVKHI